MPFGFTAALPGRMDWDLEFLSATLPVFLIITYIVWAVVQSLLEEAAEPSKRWWKVRRLGAVGSRPLSVRKCVERLSSHRRAVRREAAELLGQLNDRTAVPALMRAMDRNRSDVPFLLTAVQSLHQLGDARALPALRELTTGRSASLMQAAREAVSAIEAKSVLLRAASAPEPSGNALLRPAADNAASGDPATLLRVTEARRA